MIDPELIIAIEAIVNRLLDERDTQRVALEQRTASEAKGRLSALLQETASGDLHKRFDQHWENAAKRQQERAEVRGSVRDALRAADLI